MTTPLRRLWALIYWLPPDSAYVRSLKDDPHPEQRRGVSVDDFAQQFSHLLT